MQKKFRFLTLALFVLSILPPFQPAVTFAVSKDSRFFLTQDPTELRNSDGKIVNQRLLENVSGPKSIDCYKIQYLSDGFRVVGFIVKPRKIESKLPVIIYNRGGGLEYGKITKTNLRYLSLLASKGYVILASQYRGNDGGEGREQFGGDDVHDVLNLFPLARSLTFTDPSRMVMLGYSRGGMMTYLAIKEGAPIRAAAVVGGVTDLLQLYMKKGHDKMDYVIRELVGSNMQEYEDRSAYYWPEKIDVPILILHGGEDHVVDVSQAKKFGERLQELGKVYQLVIFPKGDHGLNGDQKKRDRLLLEWFEKYLR